MTKKLTPWEKQRRMIIRNIESGKIVYDNNFYLADFDGLTFLVVGSLYPTSYTLAWMEMQTIINDYPGETVSYKTLMKGATKEELQRLEDDKERL